MKTEYELRLEDAKLLKKDLSTGNVLSNYAASQLNFKTDSNILRFIERMSKAEIKQLLNL